MRRDRRWSTQIGYVHCRIPRATNITYLYLQPYFQTDKESEAGSPSSWVFSRKGFPKSISYVLSTWEIIFLFSTFFLDLILHACTNYN